MMRHPKVGDLMVTTSRVSHWSQRQNRCCLCLVIGISFQAPWHTEQISSEVFLKIVLANGGCYDYVRYSPGCIDNHVEFV